MERTSWGFEPFKSELHWNPESFYINQFSRNVDQDATYDTDIGE